MGDLNNLVLEGRLIQHQFLKLYAQTDSSDHIANQSSKLMSLGKTKAALDLLAHHENGGGGQLLDDDTISKENG